MSTQFDTTEFEFSHGCAPRGRGSWAFQPVFDLVESEDGLAWACGTYGEAKRKVRAKYPHVIAWVVMP